MRPVTLCSMLLVTGCGGTPAPAPPESPLVSEIDRLAERLIDDEWTVGLSVAVLDPAGTTFRQYGRSGLAPDATPLTPDTRFEIGSITKVFTGLLLADAVSRGRVRPSTPVGELVGWSIGAEVTLERLTTHTAGLPRMPSVFAPADPSDPYADYGADQLEKAVVDPPAPFAPPGDYAYSNLGAGLLGHALGRAAGSDYATALKARVLDPLGMAATDLDARPDDARGHRDTDTATSWWRFDALAGAGAVRSSARDMAALARAALSPPDSAIGAALRHSLERHADREGGGMGYGWNIGSSGEPEVRWHNGQTGGFHAFIAVDPATQTGVVVLANTAVGVVDALGLAMLDAARGRPAKLALPPSQKVSEEILETYAGTYIAELAPGAELVFTVTREAHRLFVQLVGQPRLRVYAASPTTFAYRVVDARIEFEPGQPAPTLTLHQNQQKIRAVRRTAHTTD